MAINKESNVPGKSHLDKKKQVPLLYSTMLRKMYLKCPEHEDSMESELSCQGQINVSRVTRSVGDIKIKDDLSGSHGSLPFKKEKMREKDCSCM